MSANASEFREIFLSSKQDKLLAGWVGGGRVYFDFFSYFFYFDFFFHVFFFSVPSCIHCSSFGIQILVKQNLVKNMTHCTADNTQMCFTVTKSSKSGTTLKTKPNPN